LDQESSKGSPTGNYEAANFKISDDNGTLVKDELRSRVFEETTPGTWNITVEIIIPTLNEEETIGELIRNIHSSSLPFDLSILVIDGRSTDGTLDICKREKVRFIIQKGKGKGSAMREAVELSDADIIVFIDGDGTYSLADLELLLQPLLSGESDIVIGSRVLGRREKGAIPIFNNSGNKIFNRAISFAMKTTITDSLSGYRALFRKTFRDLLLISDAFEIEVEMTVEALAKGYRVLEVPVSYGLRRGSTTKLDPLRDGIKIARTLLFILMNLNPLKFFAIIALGFFVAGIYPAVQVLHEKIYLGQIISMPSVVLSSLLFMTGTISLVVGMVSELVVRSRRRLEYLINRNLQR
jgi:dolichol-phosphate hexosyltransferase